MTIRALLFDADEVLQYPEQNRDAALRGILGFMPDPVSDFVADVHAAEDTTLTGELDFLEVLQPVLSRWGAGTKTREIREWLDLVTVDHGMLALVAALRTRGYSCALATNQQPHRAKFMAEQLGYRTLFDRCFFSCEMRLAKPNPRYFETILRELRLKADECLFIDDKPPNVEAAQSVGMNAICFVNSRDGRAQSALSQKLAELGVAAEV